MLEVNQKLLLRNGPRIVGNSFSDWMRRLRSQESRDSNLKDLEDLTRDLMELVMSGEISVEQKRELVNDMAGAIKGLKNLNLTYHDSSFSASIIPIIRKFETLIREQEHIYSQ